MSGKLLNPYYYIQSLKNYLYKNNYIKPNQFKIPVVSVGNLTTGGTGKTPIILEIVKFILEEKKLISAKELAVISRNYKAKLKCAEEVSLIKTAEYFGDEPFLIKSLLPNVHVWSGPVKARTLQLAEEKNQHLKLALIDDGFSHRKIQPQWSIVLIDISRDLKHYQLLPAGHLREPLSELYRADQVIFTKVEQKNIETEKFFKQYLFDQKMKAYQASFLSEVEQTQSNDQYILFSGLGNTEHLKNSLKKNQSTIVEVINFGDHHQYSREDENKLLEIYDKHLNQFDQDLSKNKKLFFITTQKDFVKIKNEKIIKLIKIINLKVEIEDEFYKEFYEKICNLVSK